MPDKIAGISDDEILKEARKRYERATGAASRNVQRYRDAMTFVAGDQWDERLKQFRTAAQRPCLTMDRLGTHINQVVNDQRQSKPAIKVHPVDDRADIKVAEIYDGVILSIERQSNAPMVYETASYTQVAGGQGAWRVLTEYVGENSFEQDIFLRRITDPTSIVFDPDAREMDASDGKFAFAVETKTREAFDEEYPDVQPADWASASDPQGWWGVDTVRCAEYYRLVMKDTVLHLLADGSVMDEAEFEKASIPPPFPTSPWMPPQSVATRPAKKREIQWFKLGGNSVIRSQVWPGIWIPLIRVVGNEMVVDGETIYTGLTHRAMDAQRMYNYQTSVVVEMLSLQKTAPYIGAKGQFKGVEQRWNQANTNNPAYLEYEPVTINDTLAPAPARQPSPQVPTGNVQAMQLAAEDLQWITGQHAANFGAASNETSGKAINARQREGDTATYHYLDNLSRGILHTGRILIDLIPKIYDTARVLRTLGEDDTANLVKHDPAQPQAMTTVQGPKGVEKIYNLGVGRYDVAVSVGPSFGTKRAESVEAMTALLQANPAMWQAIGDLFVGSQDWPAAQQMKERLAKMVPPELRSDEETQNDPMAQVAQLQATAQQLTMQLEQAKQMLQQADMMGQKAAEEIQTLRAQAQEKAAQQQDKTQAAVISAQSEEVRAQADVEIARINAQAEMAKAAQAQAQQEIGAIEQQFAAIQQQLQAIAQAASAPPEKEGAKQVQFQRGPDGRIVGAVVMEQ